MYWRSSGVRSESGKNLEHSEAQNGGLFGLCSLRSLRSRSQRFATAR